MNKTSEISGALRQTLLNPARDVVGLVDDLLSLCREHRLRLDWRAGRCRAGSAPDEEVAVEVPVRTSVFRAILARIAVLCNVWVPASVSPYGGQGTLSDDADPPTVFRVAFANTAAEHWLQLEPVAAASDGDTPRQGQPVARAATGDGTEARA